MFLATNWFYSPRFVTMMKHVNEKFQDLNILCYAHPIIGLLFVYTYEFFSSGLPMKKIQLKN